ncbi:MAG: VWA domain-containing protein [Chitinivibrionales bacterium]|nr:VWA domain-containing protein [Chitinivibrionales bacterium]
MFLKNGTFQQLFVCCALVAIIGLNPVSLEAQPFSLQTGMLYKNWNDSIDAMPCVLSIQPPKPTTARRYTLQILLCVDIAQALEGNTQQSVKKAVRTLVGGLSDKDMFGLVTCAKVPQVLFDLQPLNMLNKRNAEAAIDRIKYEQERIMADLFPVITQQFEKFKGQQSTVRYVFMITAGRPAIGQQTDSLLTVIDALHKRFECRFYTFGLGESFSEDFLIQSSSRSGGHFFFIDDERETDLPLLVESQMNRLRNIIAQSIDIQFQSTPQVQVQHLSFGKNGGATISLLDICSQDTQRVFFELAGSPPKKREIQIAVTYKDLYNRTPQKLRFYLDVPGEPGPRRYNPNSAEMILEYETQSLINEQSQMLFSDNPANRSDFHVIATKLVKNYETVTYAIRSGYGTQALTLFNDILQEIENPAIEREVLIKKLKFRLLQLSYGKSK